MVKSFIVGSMLSAALLLTQNAWAATAANTSSGGQTGAAQTPMMNSNDPAANATMQNGAMQQAMPTTPSANGGALKDSAEANEQKMMMQQNTN